MHYVIHYGSCVPYSAETFSTWKEACAFMKGLLDNCHSIHSVTYEGIET